MAGTVMYIGSYALDLENMFSEPEEFVKYLYNIQDQEKRESILCQCMRDDNFIDWLESHVDDARSSVWRSGINTKKGEKWLYIEGLTGLELAAPSMKRRIQVLCAQAFKDMPEFWILQDEHVAYYKSKTEEGKAVLDQKEVLRSLGNTDLSGESDALAVSGFRKMIENIDAWMKNIKDRMLNNYILYQTSIQGQSTQEIECIDARGYFVESEAGQLIPIGYLREKNDSGSGKILEKGMDQIYTQAVNRVTQLAKDAENKRVLAEKRKTESKCPGFFWSTVSVIGGCLALILGAVVMIRLVRGCQAAAWQLHEQELNVVLGGIAALALISIWQGVAALIKWKYCAKLNKCIKDAAGREKTLMQLVEKFNKEKGSWSDKEAIAQKQINLKDISYIQTTLSAIEPKLKKKAHPVLIFLVLLFIYNVYDEVGAFSYYADYYADEQEKKELEKTKAEVLDESDLNAGDLIEVHPDQVEASSSLQSSEGTYYGPENLIDGDLNTSWQEGVEGYGEGEALRFSFAEPKTVQTISINAGSWVSEERYYANGRPAKLTVVFSKEGTDIKNETVTLEDEMVPQFVVLKEAVECDSIYMRIDATYPGDQYEDTVIAEVGIYEN